MKPWHANASACHVPLRLGARANYSSDYLMPGHNILQLRRKLAFHYMEIGAADAAGTHLDQHFIRFRLRLRKITQGKRMSRYGIRVRENHRSHGANLCSISHT